MSTNFDLDINNYSTSDLLKFLKLQDIFDLNDIEKKVNEMINDILFSNNKSPSDEKYKSDVITFIKLAKEALISSYHEIQNEIEIKKKQLLGKDNNLGRIINPLSGHQSLQTHSIPEKSAVSYKHNIVKSILVFNTASRDNFFGTNSSNCSFDLPIKMSNIISISLASIQIPNVMLAFTKNRTNVYIYIFENDTSVGEIITIPEGNYSRYDASGNLANILDDFTPSMAFTLEKAINLVFNNISGSLQNRFSVNISNSTGKTTISNSSSNFSMNMLLKNKNDLDFENLCSPYVKPIRDRATDSKTSLNPTQFIATLGYSLGYRNLFYSGKNSYESEGVFTNRYSSYLYFALNDYTGSQTASNTYALLQNSLISDQILAVIPLNGPRFNYIFDNGANFIYKKRDYFGPVDITKISIKLLNQIGELVNLLESEYSFSLEVTRVYDLNNPYDVVGSLGQFSNVI
jgi:hypothetical protein